MSDDEVTYRSVNFRADWTLTKLNEPFVALRCPHCEYHEVVSADARGELPWIDLRTFMHRHLKVSHGASEEDVIGAVLLPPRVTLARIVEVLSAYTDEDIAIWLDSPNRYLGGERPLDLIRQHAAYRVLAAAMIEGGI